MTELGELADAVLKAQQWAINRAGMHERQWQAAVAGQPARHRKLLKRLADELSIGVPSGGPNKERVRRSELALRSRVLKLVDKVGASGWDLMEQQKIVSKSVMCERMEVRFAALDLANWYGRLGAKTRLYKEVYVCASALRAMWSEVLALLAKIEAEHDDSATTVKDLLQIWTCLERQKELVERYADAYRRLHNIIMEEYKEVFKARAIEGTFYETRIDIGVEALSKAMQTHN